MKAPLLVRETLQRKEDERTTGEQGVNQRKTVRGRLMNTRACTRRRAATGTFWHWQKSRVHIGHIETRTGGSKVSGPRRQVGYDGVSQEVE